MSRTAHVAERRQRVAKLDSHALARNDSEIFCATHTYPLPPVRFSSSSPILMPMRFFSAHQVIAMAGVAPVTLGCVHVWPLLFQDRESLRGLVRHLLGMYCAVEPSALEFTAGEYGKPALAAHLPFARAVSYNLSHSRDRALLAVSDGRELGIDIEQIRPRTNALALASRYFFSTEKDAVANAADEEREAVFLRFWTAKEAVIKAQGIGLSAPLDCFRVVFDGACETAAVETFRSERIEPDWFVRTLPVEKGWSAAVVARGRDWEVRVLEPPAMDA
jgi:4'-phosphopantetheinyl transferase